jgi:arsenite methyltransferase
MTIQVIDPPMCCSTGVCGPEVDPALVAFANDLNRLKRQGADILRYNMVQSPAVFVDTVAVYNAITTGGTDVLPIILKDGVIVSKGRYPPREELESLVDGHLETIEMLNIPGQSAACCDPGSGCC